jgi:hypothetical protein
MGAIMRMFTRGRCTQVLQNAYPEDSYDNVSSGITLSSLTYQIYG